MFVDPLVSIIIPTKDRFEWFRDCLHSVLEQNYPAIEIIVIDDGSSKPLREFIVETWDGLTDRIKIIRNDVSLGPGVSREMGRQIAKGDYISYLDSDDVIHPHKIRKQVNYLMEHPEIGMCYCRCNVFSELPLTGSEKEWRQFQDGAHDFLPKLLINRTWGTSACLWTKEATDQIGPWSSLCAGEDQEYEFRAGLLGIKAFPISEVLCYIRRSSNFPQLNMENTFCRTEDAKMYISIANQATSHQDRFDQMTIFMICRNLFLSSIFLLSQKNKILAQDCIHALINLKNDNIIIQAVYKPIQTMTKFFPCYFMYRLLHLSRYRIIQITRIAI